MPWTLEIHHIDVGGSGDSTLIVAREIPVLPGALPTVRSALIDGGLVGNGPTAVNYLLGQLGPNELSVLIATHYDRDHIGGLMDVLLTPGLCDHVRIYDQGWSVAGADPIQIRYLLAINGVDQNSAVQIPPGTVAQRTRITSRVLADGFGPVLVPIQVSDKGTPVMPLGGIPAINQGPSWLLNGVGRPADILWDGYPGGAPLGAPRMECIAANCFTRAPGGAVAGPFGGNSADPANEKSLAFRVIFGNFSYYVGGDLTRVQEDHLPAYLNPNNNAAGRVLAMKTSHHGANTATSRGFVNALCPEAAFISCGPNNVERHPAQATVNILDGFDPNPANANPVPRHPVAVPPYRPVSYYLTGYQDTVTPQSLAGDAGLTAGDPLANPVAPGDIVVRVSGVQALVDVRGHLYQGVRSAVTAAGTAPGIASPLAPADVALGSVNAAEAAISRGAGWAASAVVTISGFPGAHAAVVAAINNTIAPGAAAAPTANAVAAAATGAALLAGVTDGAAAAAGAAAGATFAGGDPAEVQNAVQAALGAAGVVVPLGAPAAAGPGMFTVHFHDRTLPAGSPPYTHY